MIVRRQEKGWSFSGCVMRQRFSVWVSGLYRVFGVFFGQFSWLLIQVLFVIPIRGVVGWQGVQWDFC